ncbi:MAG: alpha/beta hydrolase [Zoogloeaceae bacterium]|jgi:pimeloyl-ACP methyl ester carboxylesterase|nr:alpha/beta hydrolase [Zoogloeaceae bacterium]
MPPSATSAFVILAPQGRKQTLEYAWINAAAGCSPTLVFLHEGLGSVALWRDFPKRLCARLGWRGLVYSRRGYGASSPRPHDEPLPRHYLRREAVEVLPALLAALGVARPWLIGHSDGGTIALLAAALLSPHRDAASCSGIVTLAPHYYVEDVCLEGIRRAAAAFERGDLRARLARHHQDVDGVFHGWRDVWLDPAYRDWSIEAELCRITCPALAIQGDADEYATLEQINGIKRQAPQTKLCVLPQCGHSPHLQLPEPTLDAIEAFIRAQDQNPASVKLL